MENPSQNSNPTTAPGSKRTSVGSFVEGTMSSTFLLVTIDQGLSLYQQVSGTLGKAIHPLYVVIKTTVFLKG